MWMLSQRKERIDTVPNKSQPETDELAYQSKHGWISKYLTQPSFAFRRAGLGHGLIFDRERVAEACRPFHGLTFR